MQQWGADARFWARRRVLVRQLLRLVEVAPGAYATAGGVPVRHVQICGQVVAATRREKLAEYLVDDGTGCVRVVQWDPPGEAFARGATVSAWGWAGAYRGQRQLTAGAAWAEREGPMAVALHWAEAMAQDWGGEAGAAPEEAQPRLRAADADGATLRAMERDGWLWQRQDGDYDALWHREVLGPELETVFAEHGGGGGEAVPLQLVLQWLRTRDRYGNATLAQLRGGIGAVRGVRHVGGGRFSWRK